MSFSVSARHEQLGAARQQGLHARRPVDHAAIGQLALGIDRRAGVLVAPTADRVEMLERETDRVHLGVTARTRGVRAVANHRLAQVQGRAITRILRRKRRHIRRRRRRR